MFKRIFHSMDKERRTASKFDKKLRTDSVVDLRRETEREMLKNRNWNVRVHSKRHSSSNHGIYERTHLRNRSMKVN
jgi:hypothetical protein